MTLMRSPAEFLKTLPEPERLRELESLTEDARAYLLYHWPFWARADQIAPLGDWTTWLILAGRGWGKTRTGAEWVRSQVCPDGRISSKGAQHVALVAETAADARDVMVEGPAGLLAIHPRSERPTYEPSKRRITWSNGAIATLYNATEPDQLRGPQHDLAWSDELAKWRYARETWDQLQFGLRLGSPRQVVTTTPRPIPIVRELLKDADTVATRGRTMDNAANLSPVFMKRITARYEGTRLGRQELEAEVLDDTPGALWSRDGFDRHRLTEPPALERIVVAVDPAVTSGETSEDPGTHGIVVAGKGKDGRGFILADGSKQGTPNEWARRVKGLFREWCADTIVAEINQGGEMVRSTIRTVGAGLPVKLVRATRGKHVRAEPISGLYEQGRISHVGQFDELEDQFCQFTTGGYEGEGSPDRADAAVWALTELFGDIIWHADDDPTPQPEQTDPWADDSEVDEWKVL